MIAPGPLIVLPEGATFDSTSDHVIAWGWNDSDIAALSVGETADFAWTPNEPGTYELHVGYAPAPEAHLVQRWVVRPR